MSDIKLNWIYQLKKSIFVYTNERPSQKIRCVCYRDDRIVILSTLGMTEKNLSSHSALGFKNSSEADQRTETGQMMAMEITNDVEAELKAEGRRATNTGKI